MTWRIIGTVESKETQGSVADAVGVTINVLKICGIHSKTYGMVDTEKGKSGHVLLPRRLTDTFC